MSPSKDESSLDDDEFVIPEDPIEQGRFKRRLMPWQIALRKSNNSFKLIKIC